MTLPVTMRANPTVTNNNTAATNINSTSTAAQNSSQVYATGNNIGAGQFNYAGILQMSADL
jgi:hypothetical protein